jgi:hypothetical protein
MGVYDDNVLMATSDGSKFDKDVALTSGIHDNTVVQYWDYCGNSGKKRITVNVSSGSTSTDTSSSGKTISNIEDRKGWIGYGELPPKYGICTDCRPKVTWGMKQGISSPAVGTVSTRFDVGGSVPYSDALFVHHLLGDGSTLGILDRDETLLHSIHHLIYDVYFYSDHLEHAHALEFDVGLNLAGRAHMFGTECRTEAKKVWAIWDNQGKKWVDTSAPCTAQDGKWNHLVMKFERTSDNHLIYHSITLNGKTYTLNRTYNSLARDWHGLVVNFQLDGNKNQTDYSVYLDKLSITYY